MLNHYLKISPEVSEALTHGKPIVALESTIIAHGMPYPKNVETALTVENIVRKNGATPATIAIIDGKLCVGLSKKEIRHLGKLGRKVVKVSRRDIPFTLSKKITGATTVASTMIIASIAKIIPVNNPPKFIHIKIYNINLEEISKNRANTRKI